MELKNIIQHKNIDLDIIPKTQKKLGVYLPDYLRNAAKKGLATEVPLKFGGNSKVKLNRKKIKLLCISLKSGD